MFTLRKEAIIQSVIARLNADFRTGGQTIDVVMANGDVILVGWCDNDEQRNAAIMITSGTCGVKEVIDRIQVRALKFSI